MPLADSRTAPALDKPRVRRRGKSILQQMEGQQKMRDSCTICELLKPQAGGRAILGSFYDEAEQVGWVCADCRPAYEERWGKIPPRKVVYDKATNSIEWVEG